MNAIETQVQDHGTKGFWRINLRDGLQPGKSVVVSILSLFKILSSTMLAHLLRPKLEIVIFIRNINSNMIVTDNKIER